MGLCSYYRKLVVGFSEIAAPLHAQTHKNHWCQWPFEALKEKLVSSPVLALPRDLNEFILDIDASDHAIGAFLRQIQDGEKRLIGYFSS